MTRRAACLALLLSAPLAALDLLPADATAGALPPGWQLHHAWNAPFITTATVDGATVIRIAPQKPGDVIVKHRLDMPAGQGDVTLRATVTCRDPQPGSETWQTPHLALRALGADGKNLGKAVSRKITAAIANEAVTLTLAPPEGAAAVQVEAGFLRAGGILEISRVSISR